MTHFEQWLAHPIKQVDKIFEEAAFSHQQQLTKPAGSLGQQLN